MTRIVRCSHRESFFLLYLVIASASSASIVLTEKELECYSLEKVYHQKSNKCYKLLTKGPCDAGEWLVLERPNKNERTVAINPVCAKERCDEGEYYWVSARSCVQTKDARKLCGQSQNEELLNNVFGEGECSCAREPPRARLNGVRRNPCYPLYTRGPCRLGQVIVLPENETMKATCIDDPCHKESIFRKLNGTLSEDGILAPFGNGTCYELGTQGPCSDDQTFKVHSVIKRPLCTSLLNNIFSGVKQCPVDENGDCQVEVIKKKGIKYLKELEDYLKNK